MIRGHYDNVNRIYPKGRKVIGWLKQAPTVRTNKGKVWIDTVYLFGEWDAWLYPVAQG